MSEPWTTEQELEFYKRQAECDCVPALVSSRACRKCGRRGIITQKHFNSMVGEMMRVQTVALDYFGEEELARRVEEEFPGWTKLKERLDAKDNENA